MNDNMTDEQVKRLEEMIAALTRSQRETELTIETINRDIADVQLTLFGSQGKAGNFQRGLVALFLDLQKVAADNQKSIAELVDLFHQQKREADIVRETIKSESDKSFDKMKRLFTIAGGIITVITLLQLIINWLLASP